MPVTKTTASETEPKTQKSFSTKLTRINDNLMPLIEGQLTNNGIKMTDYQKTCVLMGISAMNTVLDSAGLTWGAPGFDDRSVTEILQRVAALQLNAAANPREIYFQLRNQKVKGPDGAETWKKQIEMGIEGDGNDSILRRFGADVKEVGQFWQVREEDEFVYPKHKGFDMSPPEWTETGRGRVVRIVYPILKDNDRVEFHIAEREDVKKNLAAHVSNNLMNETFGICRKRYDATPDQLKQIAARKKSILDKLAAQSLDAALDDPDLQPYISPAWTEPQSRESMIIRKMRNNVVKKIPKDFSNAYIASVYMNATDDTKMLVDAEIAEDANSKAIDVEYDEVPTDPETGEIIGDGAEEQTSTEPMEPVGEAESVQGPQGEDGQITLGEREKPRTRAKKDPF